MSARSRSVRTEIVAGFATLILAFGSVAAYSHRLQTRAVESMRLANEGYLRLTLLLDEVRVNQGVFNTLLDRLPDERDRVNSRTWIAAARRTRRAKIAQCRTLALASLRGPHDPEDARLLGRAVADLEAIDRTYEQDEPAFDALFQALGRADMEALARIQEDRLLVREGAAEDALRGLTRDFQRRVQTLSDEAEARQHRSAQLTLVATAVACALGLATTLNARRSLQPLALLRDRARAVARGDLGPASVPARPDEIGELAGEFERMVSAIRGRDAALRSANVEIQAAERHLEQVVASLRAAVMVVRPDGTIATANAAAEGMAAQALSGARYAATVFGRDARVAESVRTVALGLGVASGFEAVPLGERAFDLTVAPFVERGERAGALVVADDVTEREQAKARWIQAERLAAIGRMAAHVTHEVRNPLSSMALNAEMLADEVEALGEPGREPVRLVRAIQKEIDRLTGITEEYLRVARLPRPRLEREDVADVVGASLGFVAAEMTAGGVEVALEVGPSVPAAMLDEAQVRQALLNLFRNAREAMDAARAEHRRLSVRVVAAGAGVEIAVSDSGPGFAPDARGHLFELFFTTKERGTGLGLPLTREIVVAHGGTIRAEAASAAEGGGARFVIWLPAVGARGREETGSDAA